MHTNVISKSVLDAILYLIGLIEVDYSGYRPSESTEDSMRRAKMRLTETVLAGELLWCGCVLQ